MAAGANAELRRDPASPRWRTVGALAIAGVPVLGYLGLMAWGSYSGKQDNRRWAGLQDELVLEYGDLTVVDLLPIEFTGELPTPPPDGVEFGGVSARQTGGHLVFHTTFETPDRCLMLRYDEGGLVDDREIDCRAYRAAP